MPTIIVDKNKGLFQKAATSANKAGTFSGHKIAIKDVGTSDATLVEGDSGKTILFGDAEHDGAYTIQFPVIEGWHADFLLTGSNVANAVTISGSVLSTNTTVEVIGQFGADADGGAANLAVTSNKEVTVGATAAKGTAVYIKVVKASGGDFYIVANGLTDS